MKNGSGAKR
ncbi:Protein of unknown function [Bacillus mycoides]|uniref:Uncharacterized protein n=1 Tax=Bacillus mycoides TaxID=1405 RepID=A0A1G4ED63_BACMY|nr:Protein of unknown function [Bacillus mycoides]